MTRERRTKRHRSGATPLGADTRVPASVRAPLPKEPATASEKSKKSNGLSMYRYSCDHETSWSPVGGGGSFCAAPGGAMLAPCAAGDSKQAV